MFRVAPQRYEIATGVDVFPVFLFDRKNAVYNECEVVALSAHNRQRRNGGYMLTRIDLDRVWRPNLASNLAGVWEPSGKSRRRCAVTLYFTSSSRRRLMR